ncbi:hypothetical protein CYG49_03630, partial [Candidatus Saccharibacteria bacterium]
MIGHHLLHLHRIRFTEISEIFASETIKNFAFSLVGIFIPIFLLSNGMSLSSLCVLLILQNFFRFVLEPFVGRLIARFGAKHVLAISYPFSFIYILLLSLYVDFKTPIAVIALIWAIADSLHWVSYQSAFSRAKHAKQAGKEISAIGILGVIVGAVGPFIGGLIAVTYGLNAAFIVASMLLLMAMVPLFQTSETVKSERLSYKGLFKKVKRDLVAHAAISFDIVVSTTVWPLFMFFIVKDYLQLGAIVSLSFLLSIAALFFIGRLTDTKNKKKLIAVGSVGIGAIHAIRLLAVNFWLALSVNLAALIVSPLLFTPLVSLFYEHADETRRIEYVVLLEMAGDITRALFWVVLFIL